MKEFLAYNAAIVWIVVLLVVLGGASTLFYYTVIYPAQLAGQRQGDVQSRQNVVGIQTALRQDMQDAQRNQNNPALVQQDVYDMERLRDQLPDPSTEVSPDIQQFLAVHGG